MISTFLVVLACLEITIVQLVTIFKENNFTTEFVYASIGSLVLSVLTPARAAVTGCCPGAGSVQTAMRFVLAIILIKVSYMDW